MKERKAKTITYTTITTLNCLGNLNEAECRPSTNFHLQFSFVAAVTMEELNGYVHVDANSRGSSRSSEGRKRKLLPESTTSGPHDQASRCSRAQPCRNSLMVCVDARRLLMGVVWRRVDITITQTFGRFRWVCRINHSRPLKVVICRYQVLGCSE